MTRAETSRVAVVTGATGTIGAAIARRLAACGHRVTLVGRSAVALDDLAREIRTGGGEVTWIAADLVDHRQAEAAMTSVREGSGDVSILVNAAGTFGPIAPIGDTDTDEWAQTVTINAVTPFATVRAALGGMRRVGWGRIVNVSSAQTLYPPDPVVSAYATSKVALNWMTRSLARELAGTSVSACVIHPGDVTSHMWEDIAARAAQGGPAVAHLAQWADELGRTGGDNPEKAANLVQEIVEQAAVWSNGRFLMIAGGVVHHPEASWDV